MKRIISVLIAALLLCTVLVGCGGNGDAAENSATVKVTVEADGIKIVENIEVTIEGIDGDEPLAIDAIIAALEDNEIKYTLGQFAGYDRFEKIDEYELEDGKYYWELYLNEDDDPAEGRLPTVTIADGDTLYFVREEYESVVSSETTEETTKAPETAEEVDDGYEE